MELHGSHFLTREHWCNHSEKSVCNTEFEGRLGSVTRIGMLKCWQGRIYSVEGKG